MRDRSKLMAIAMVAMMLMSGVVMMTDGMEGAANNSEGFEEKEILLEGEDGPMLLGDTRATGVLEGMYPGSWTWDRTTGIGPYNSFYGAFDIDDGNRFVGVLDPYNLKQLVDGTPLSETGHFNIMWILPTVYWSVDANGNLELSSDPTKGTAYAHTIDGHVYKYVAYGVYESTSDDNSNPTILTSESGKTPLVSKSLSNFRILAQANDVSELGSNAYPMIWNYYMWAVYKYIGYTMMEDFNSQSVVGIGKGRLVQPYTLDTGLTESLGPYAGYISSTISVTTAASPMKLLLENTWGNVTDTVDGYYVHGNYTHLDSSHNPTDSSDGDFKTTIEFRIVTGYGDAIISDDARIWGLNTNANGTATIGLTDRNTYSSSISSSGFKAGGTRGANNDPVLYNGISRIEEGAGISDTNTSRIAFVFDQDPVTFTPASYDYKLNYDASLMATTSAAISVDGMDPITHDFPTYTVTVASNDTSYGTVDESSLADVRWGTEITIDGPTLTIGATTVTATPSSATEQYSYVFDGWYANGTELESGYVESALTITATFEQLEPVTVTLDLGEGTSGTTELTVFVGQPFGELPTPTPKGGYTFTGWYDPNGNEVTSETIVTETSDFTLTAHYELSDALKPVKALTDFIPILMIAGLIIAIIGTALYLRRDY